jgi:hypothetical protein
LTHYLQTIRRLTMSDPEIAQLCQTIYQRHRKAIDLIMEFGVSSRFAGTVQDVLNHDWMKEHLPIGWQDPKTNSVWFVPADWLVPLKKYGPAVGWGKFPFVVGCWLYQKTNGDSIEFGVEVGPIADHAKRCALLNGFKEMGFRVPEKAYAVETKYTRIYSNRRKRKDSDDDSTVVLQMLKKAAPQFRKITEVLKSL